MIEKVSIDGPSRHWIERASEVLRRDLLQLYRSSNDSMFLRNRDVQVGVFLANHLHWQKLERAGLRAECSAGLSLGEYNHLVHVGALDFDMALQLVEARGRAYESGPDGKMTAVFPVPCSEVETLLSSLDGTSQVWIGMVNTPHQTVLSGEAAAVDRAAELVSEQFTAECVVVDAALPMHSPLFRAAADIFRPALEAAAWQVPRRPYLPNATGEFERRAESGVFVDCLYRHIWSAVQWRTSIETLAVSAGVTTFIETGPKEILAGMLRKRWLQTRKWSTDAGGNIDESIEGIVKALADGSSEAEVAG
jgi:[acyl-carrier-protein] S-malonyltransferase